MNSTFVSAAAVAAGTPPARFRQGTSIRLDQAILFTAYATLRSDAREEKVSRARQIVDWLGRDLDGGIVFDESHAMQNAAREKSERGERAPSQQGRAGLRLQHALPNSRVLHVSATGATTVHEIAGRSVGRSKGTLRSLGDLAHTHWREAECADFIRAWEAEIAAVPEFTGRNIHVVTGLLLPIWKRLPNDSMRVYRVETDDGERVIGRLVSPAWIAQAAESDAPTLSPPDAFAAVLDGRTVLQLQHGLELRRVRVMGESRVELSGFTDGIVDRLKAMGFISEIISWKLRLLVPTGSSGPTILAKLMEGHPPVRVADKAAA